jgi:hypothetical protein
MFRRLFIATVLMAGMAGVASAQTRVTFLMKGGERIIGDLTYRGGANFVLSGREIPAMEVAVIAFVPDDPTPLEVSKVPTVDWSQNFLERHVFVLRDGTMLWGNLYQFTPDGSSVSYDSREGGRKDIASSNLARLYVNPLSARAVYAPILAGLNSSAPVGTSGGTVTIPANQQWVATGFTVRRGETLHFNATGDVQWSPDIADNATAAGARTGRRSDGAAPVPAAPGGALVARIDNGKAFLIGNQGSVRMPANGQLFLGVNDSILTDNGGNFFVTISR